MDELRHPDLVVLARSMRATFDRVLDGEHAAAAVAYRRTRSLRDHLIELEDRGSHVLVTAAGTRTGPAPLTAVGIDHIVIGGDQAPTLVPLWSIDLVEVVR